MPEIRIKFTKKPKKETIRHEDDGQAVVSAYSEEGQRRNANKARLSRRWIIAYLLMAIFTLAAGIGLIYLLKYGIAK